MGKKKSLYRGTIEDDRSNAELQYHRYVSMASTEAQRCLSWLVSGISLSVFVIAIIAFLFTIKELKTSIQNIFGLAFFPLLIVVPVLIVGFILFYCIRRARNSVKASQGFYKVADSIIKELGWNKTKEKYKIDIKKKSK